MKLLALIPLLLIGASVQAATIEIGTPSYIRPVGDQLYYFPADERAPPRVAWPGMENNARDINVPTTKGRVPVTVNQKSPVSINKLATAGLNLAKRAGPLGIGLTLAWELCDKTDICAGPSDPQNPSSPPVFTVSAPESKPIPYVRWKALQTYGGGEYETYTQACDVVGALKIAQAVNAGIWTSGTITSCYLIAPSRAHVKYEGFTKTGQLQATEEIAADRIQNCPATHNYTGGPQCIPKDPNKRNPITPAGWPAPEDVPSLNDPGIIPDLIEGGEPIPVDTPEIEPKTVPSPSGSTTETVRNGAGEPIGTKTTDTTVTVTPSGPTTVNVTETTTITETNITNNTTTTTVQDTTLPNNEDQSEKPKEDTDLDIDDVPDSEVERYEVPDTFSYESWGGGSCPGDPSISAMGRSYNLPVHTVCEAITDMRPAVLLIAALVSAFIISGAFRQ